MESYQYPLLMSSRRLPRLHCPRPTINNNNEPAVRGVVYGTTALAFLYNARAREAP